MNRRTLVANIIWRAGIVSSILTIAIAGSIITNQNINSERIRATNFQGQIDKLNSEVTALEKAAASSNSKLTQQFIGEVNYICATEAALAKADGFPPPSSGLCDLVVPAH